MVRAIVGKKVDAGIVWNAVAWANRDKVDIVDVSAEFSPDPKVDAITTATHGKLDLSQARVSVIVFDFARDRNAARAFASYVNSERSRKAFEARGFLPPRPEDSSPSPSTRQ
jgi:ABC-type molybdate transport system substrate-binding protein